METYAQGWNDYLDGRVFSWINTSAKWQEGWIAAKDLDIAGAKLQRM